MRQPIINRLLLYFHTLRHLKSIQIYSRLFLRFQTKKSDLRLAPLLNPRGDVWVKPAQRRPSLSGQTSCCFLNEEHSLVGMQSWNDSKRSMLWLYNLHYFDDLNAEGSKERSSWHRGLIARWILENPPTQGLGWQPYPLSLRIVNWIKWGCAGNTLEDEWLHSLAIQVRFLAKSLEWHLLGNHLFTNAKALVFAGLFFTGKEAQAWLNTGLEIFEREIPEQILADGGQFERSPMYHALALEDLLDLINITNLQSQFIPLRWQSFVSTWQNLAVRMQRWLSMLCHPDGEISFFNDAAIGICPSPAELERYRKSLGVIASENLADGLFHLIESGYIRVQQNDLVALLDVAHIGPNYLPGHAHADSLSFELSLFGYRVLVNSGTSCYGISPERLRQRGTAAHNTVVVDGQDSSEVWAGFRVARRARPVGLEVKSNEEIFVRCAHDGYRRLPGKPEHLRKWTFGENVLVVEDRISSRFEKAQARFYLHPSISIVEKSKDSHKDNMVLQLPQGQKVYVSIKGGVLHQENATWHPEFGCSRPNLCLVVNFNSSVLLTHFKWENVV